MKKFFASVLTLGILLTPVSSLSATDEISFWQAMGNLANIKDCKSIQSFYGNMDFMENEEHISADFRISISSTVEDGTDSFGRISAFLKFTNHNEINDATPFREMTVQANGEMVTQNQNDLYLKLNNFNIGFEEPLPLAVLDAENIMATVDLYRGTWYHSTTSELVADEAAIDLEEYMALNEQMKEDPKGAIYNLTEMTLHDSEPTLSEEEIGEIMNAIGLLLEARLFTEREVVAGRNTGFRFFNLNKGAIMNLATEIATALGEEITYEDKLALKSALGKFSLSGIYRTENTHGIIDNLLIRLKLREAGPVKNLELSYRFKLWDIDKENSVKAPTEYEELENVLGVGSYDEDMWFESEEGVESGL